jgi:hypothetical protein
MCKRRITPNVSSHEITSHATRTLIFSELDSHDLVYEP